MLVSVWIHSTLRSRLSRGRRVVSRMISTWWWWLLAVVEVVVSLLLSTMVPGGEISEVLWRGVERSEGTCR